MSFGILFNTNMAIGCMMISILESNHVGLQWSNIMEPASLDDNFTFFNVMIMFLIDTIVYFILAMYISTVFPGRYGIGRKWYYFIQPSYWFNTGNRTSIKPGQFQNQIGVEILNLCKSYNSGKIKAVNNFTLNMDYNEITVLLGHNGAGKLNFNELKFN